METKLEQIAVKAVNQLPKSVVREIRTPRSVGAGGGRLPPATRWAGAARLPPIPIAATLCCGAKRPFDVSQVPTVEKFRLVALSLLFVGSTPAQSGVDYKCLVPNRSLHPWSTRASFKSAAPVCRELQQEAVHALGLLLVRQVPALLDGLCAQVMGRLGPDRRHVE
jgi:hypothetical protein